MSNISNSPLTRELINNNITLIGRRKLTVTGVDDVESFDDQLIVLHTQGSVLLIRGHELRIEKLAVDGGDLEVIGYVDAIEYEEERGKTGFLTRLFK
ncbi:MAG: YabP/YqfC family sporulation protein [Oscillospiraceae bacterium]|jgi:sporulation protein YabP|nr:YabP/YqfC family sporulation protein [Oscillospiraceae bacterium]